MPQPVGFTYQPLPLGHISLPDSRGLLQARAGGQAGRGRDLQQPQIQGLPERAPKPPGSSNIHTHAHTHTNPACRSPGDQKFLQGFGVLRSGFLRSSEGPCAGIVCHPPCYFSQFWENDDQAWV
jgi:hypothetical protein